MNPNIHPTAIIDSSAEIAEDVSIGAYSIIGPNVKIGSGVKISTQAYLEHCEIGKNNIISTGAVIGTPPQDLGYKDELTKVLTGVNCQIREHVTINRASGEGNITKIGDNCMLMTGVHIAHNCQLGDNVILANLATLGGYVTIEDNAFLGGMIVIHQFVKIGEMSIMSGFSGARTDIPPYAKTDGRPAKIVGTNVIGLRRKGLSQDERTSIKKAYNLLWFSNLNTKQAIERIKEEITPNKYIDHLVDFVLTSKRGVAKSTNTPEKND